MNVIIRHFHNFPKRNKHHSNINRRLFMNWTGLFCVCVCVVCEEITTVLKIHLVHLPIEVAFCYVAFGWKCCICVSVSALRTRMAILKFQIGKQRSIEIRNCYHSIGMCCFFSKKEKKKTSIIVYSLFIPKIMSFSRSSLCNPRYSIGSNGKCFCIRSFTRIDNAVD